MSRIGGFIRSMSRAFGLRKRVGSAIRSLSRGVKRRLNPMRQLRKGYRRQKYITGRGSYGVASSSYRLPYRLPQPSILPSMVDSTASVPYMHAGKDGVRVRHREFIKYLNNSVGPADGFHILDAIVINPRLSASFPWLSGIAANFEQYRLHGMVVEFKTATAELVQGNSTGNTIGNVHAVVDYNVNSPAPYTSASMLNSMFSMSCKTSESMIMPVETKYNLTQGGGIFNVRTADAPAPPPGDARLYDIGVVYVGCEAVPTLGKLGQLWISYDVEFLKPITPEYGSAQRTAQSEFSNSADVDTDTFCALSQTARFAGDATWTINTLQTSLEAPTNSGASCSQVINLSGLAGITGRLYEVEIWAYPTLDNWVIDSNETFAITPFAGECDAVQGNFARVDTKQGANSILVNSVRLIAQGSGLHRFTFTNSNINRVALTAQKHVLFTLKITDVTYS
jgi:hypothetical protein